MKKVIILIIAFMMLVLAGCKTDHYEQPEEDEWYKLCKESQ